MSLGRLLKFALFGHTAASVAAYELGKHKPLGYNNKETSAEKIKSEIKRTATVELIAAGGIYFIKPETAIILIAYSFPYYAYKLGRYHANAAEDHANSPLLAKK